MRKKYDDDKAREILKETKKSRFALNDIIRDFNLSEDFLEEYKDQLNWTTVCSRQKLSEDFIRRHKKDVHWTMISAKQKLSMPFIEEFEDKINWSWVASHQNVNMKFIEKHIDKLEIWMKELIIHKKLSMRFLNKHIESFDNVTLKFMCKFQKLTINFIKNHLEYFDKLEEDNSSEYWKLITYFQKELDDEIIEHILKNIRLERNIIIMGNLCRYHKIPECLIDKYSNLFIESYCGDLISQYQNVSVKFIYKYSDKLHLDLNVLKERGLI